MRTNGIGWLIVSVLLSQQFNEISCWNAENKSLPVVMWHGMGKIIVYISLF